MKLGKYQLVRKLAVGGMAEVFLARAEGARGFQKQLVVKKILPHLAEDAAFVQMFLDEAQLAARLSHPNLVQIFDFGEDSGTYFIAMEYVDGASMRSVLDQVIVSGQQLPAPICAKVISQACEALQYVHDYADEATGQPLGLIHRDISPDNIMVGRNGAVRVVDFGIAKPSLANRAKSGLIKGKLAYMPPEQLQVGELDRRADIYALGATLFELLTQRLPFERESDSALMGAILAEPCPLLKTLRPDLPASLQRAVDWSLAKDRNRRQADCAVLQAQLEGYLKEAGAPVSATQVGRLVQALIPREKTDPGAPSSVLTVEATQMRGSVGGADLGPAAFEGTAVRGSSSEPLPAPTPENEAWTQGIGLDPEGKLHLPEEAKPGASAAQAPTVIEEAPLEFARELTRKESEPSTPELWKPPPGRWSKPTTWIAAGLTLAVVALGAVAVLHRDRILPAVARHGGTPLLVVESNPPGAQVIIDGQPVGQTPWSSDNVYPQGSKVPLELKLAGFAAWQGSFTGGTEGHVTASLARLRQ